MSNNETLRIVVDARSMMCSNPRGEGKSLARLYAEIGKLRPQWTITFYGEGRREKSQHSGNAEYRYFDLRGARFDTWQHVGLPYQVSRDRPDVVHCTSSGWPLFLRRKGIMTVHDVIPAFFDDGQSAAQKRIFMRDLQRGLRRAKAIVAVSENTRHDLCNRFDADPSRIHVIHWGSDPRVENNDIGLEGEKWLADHGVVGEVVLALGGGAPRKNIWGTLEAFARTASGAGAAVLVVTGISNGGLRERLVARARELGVENRLQIFGYVSEQELSWLYTRATVFLYLSFYEGFGLPILEAMRYGTAVVASNASSIPEVTGDAAALVDPADSAQAAKEITRLLSSESERAALTNRGYERLRNFRWESTAQKTVALIEAVANR